MSGKAELEAIISTQIAALLAIKSSIPNLPCYDRQDHLDSALNIMRAIHANAEINAETEIKLIDLLRSYGSTAPMNDTDIAQYKANRSDDYLELITPTIEQLREDAFGRAA